MKEKSEKERKRAFSRRLDLDEKQFVGRESAQFGDRFLESGIAVVDAHPEAVLDGHGPVQAQHHDLHVDARVHGQRQRQHVERVESGDIERRDVFHVGQCNAT